jgi:hypothetical protein
MMYKELALKRLNESIDLKEVGGLLKHGRFTLRQMESEQDGERGTRTVTAWLTLPNGIEIKIEKGWHF